MAKLFEIGKLKDSFDKLRKKHGISTKPEDLEAIASSLSSEVISQFNSFATDRIKAIDSKVESIEGLAVEIKDAASKAVNSSQEYVHAEKDRLLGEYKNIKGHISNQAKQVKQEIDSRAISVNKGITESLVKMDSTMKRVQEEGISIFNDIGKMKTEIRDVVKVSGDQLSDIVRAAQYKIEDVSAKHRDKILKELVEYAAKNLGAIIWKWIKGKFSKKQ